MKLAVLSHILPPSPSGQAMILRRLLRELEPGSYCLLSCFDYNAPSVLQSSPLECVSDSSPKLQGRYHYLPPGFQLSRPNRFGLSAARESVNILLQILQRARQVAAVVRRERCGAILACTGNLIDLPAGYLASRWTRLPFYAYLFDDFLYQWTRPLDRRLAGWAEPVVIRGAAGIIVPNEFLGEEYRRRYRVSPTVIHNPHDDSEGGGGAASWPASEGEIRIVYAGAVYHAHYDAFRNLVAALEQLTEHPVKLHLYTAQPRQVLERERISGPITHHPHIAPAAVFEVQRRADILFLPLAFDSEIPEVIRTSAPGKMGEYLASGRPILVHAPPDSFVSWYFQKHNCGVVVSRSDPAALARAIRDIIDRPELRRTIGENARARARDDFSLGAARAEFVRLFQSGGKAGAGSDV